MSFGRGRGRGGFGARRNYDAAKPFVIFPEISLPDPKLIITKESLPGPKLTKEESKSINFNFHRFFRNSPYHLGDGVLKKENESLDIERFSDALKPKKKLNQSGSFYDYLVLRPDNFPKELLGDTSREQRPAKRVKWNMDADLKKLDVFEKLEAKLKAEGKEDADDVEEEDEESDEDDADAEYEINQDFDDDEDDYNPPSDGEREDYY